MLSPRLVCGAAGFRALGGPEQVADQLDGPLQVGRRGGVPASVEHDVVLLAETEGRRAQAAPPSSRSLRC